MMDADDIEVLLALDGSRYEAGAGYVVEFEARRVDVTPERPHGLSYALVFRPVGGEPYIRFDNAHAVARPGGRYVKPKKAYDHWHRTQADKGRPYDFVSAIQLLEDFWREVKRVMSEKEIPNDLQ